LNSVNERALYSISQSQILNTTVHITLLDNSSILMDSRNSKKKNPQFPYEPAAAHELLFFLWQHMQTSLLKLDGYF